MPVRTARSDSRAWRAAVAFVSLGLLAWGFAAALSVAPTGARAETGPRFRDVDALLVVPRDGQFYHVKIDFFMFDNGDGTFAETADTARAEMAARFPGAIVIDPESASAAYVTSGFKWMSSPVSWGYDGSGAHAGVAGSASSALQAAAATWGQQGASVSMSGGGPSGNGTGACGGGTDGSNTVGWAEQSGSVLAVTCTWFGSGSPFRPAVEFDMEIDPGWNWTTGGSIQVDLQSVALHEFGHALGLNHSASSSAVMYASYTSGTSKRTPSADDIAGIQAIYGGQGGATNTPTNTPAATSTPTRTPTPAASPSNSPTPAGSTATPTQPLSTSTPTPPGSTRTPTPFPPTSTPAGGGAATPTPTKPSATSTPTPAATTTPAAAATATPTPGSSPSLPLVPGANLFAWPGGDSPAAQAVGSVPNLKVVYSYDPVTGNWSRFVPGAPAFLNNLLTLKQGAAYWFIATGTAQVPFQP